MYSERIEAAPGAVSQLRECTAELVRFAKASGTAVLLVGHVTKEGQIAGPRVLEHMVDTVLYFESDTGSRFRVLRSVKNRFGAANEIGVFAMVEQGLREVTNPSAIFLSRHAEPVPGSVITVMREGTRSLLIEVQVLADASLGANPRRVAVGIDGNRLTMLLAVAHRHAGLLLQGQDVFANVVGGVRLAETAGDLAIVMAARSSLRDAPVPNSLIAFGELGLAGEIRPVPFGEERLREAAKHGFKSAVVPEANVPKRAPEGMTVRGVTRLNQALESFSPSRSLRLDGIRRPDAHGLDGVIPGLQHLEHVVGQFQSGAGLRDGLEKFHDQTVECFGSVGGQIPAHGTIQRADRGGAVGNETAVGLGVHILVHHGRRVGGELADDFLENILDCHQTLNVAVLIDHERHAALVALKVQSCVLSDVPDGTK